MTLTGNHCFLYLQRPDGRYLLNATFLLQILEKLQADPLAQVPAAKEALTELSTLFNLLGHMQGLHHIEFNMSLARGLDYYTGVIYEAVMLKSWNGGQPQVGSVAAGGR